MPQCDILCIQEGEYTMEKRTNEKENEKKSDKTEKTTTKTTPETTTKNTVKKLNENQEKIINLILQNPFITLTQMANELYLTKDGVRYNIDKLKKSNLISRKGSNKKGMWIIH